MDFGLAQTFNQIEETGETVVGTVAYMAAELWLGQAASEVSDLYAVGVMLYEILAGRHPFVLGDTSRLIENILTSKPDMALLTFTDTSSTSTMMGQTFEIALEPALLNTRLAPIVQRLLSKRASERYPSASAVIAALSDALDLPKTLESPAIRESFLQAATFVGRDSELSQLEVSLVQIFLG